MLASFAEHTQCFSAFSGEYFTFLVSQKSENSILILCVWKMYTSDRRSWQKSYTNLGFQHAKCLKYPPFWFPHFWDWFSLIGHFWFIDIHWLLIRLIYFWFEFGISQNIYLLLNYFNTLLNVVSFSFWQFERSLQARLVVWLIPSPDPTFKQHVQLVTLTSRCSRSSSQPFM